MCWYRFIITKLSYQFLKSDLIILQLSLISLAFIIIFPKLNIMDKV